MQVGDLVTYKKPPWKSHWVGIVLREIPGTQEVRVIRWFRPKEITGSYIKNQMEVISESR